MWSTHSIVSFDAFKEVFSEYKGHCNKETAVLQFAAFDGSLLLSDFYLLKIRFQCVQMSLKRHFVYAIHPILSHVSVGAALSDISL